MSVNATGKKGGPWYKHNTMVRLNHCYTALKTLTDEQGGIQIGT